MKETFTTTGNLKSMLLIVFGGCAAQATLMQTTHFVMIFYLQRTVLLSLETTLLIVAAATLLGFPFFQLFGALSDKVGRKIVMLSGLILSALLVPLAFYVILQQGNPDHVNRGSYHRRRYNNQNNITDRVSAYLLCYGVWTPWGIYS